MKRFAMIGVLAAVAAVLGLVVMGSGTSGHGPSEPYAGKIDRYQVITAR